MSKVNIFSDGASRGNPGEAGIGVVIYSDSNETLAEIAEYIGIKTNNVAEYQALIRGLEEALGLGATEVQVFADSELMVKQMRGEYKVKNAGLQPLYQKAKLLSLKFSGFQINHVLREKNKEADLLANRGIDRKNDKTANTCGEQVTFAFKQPKLTLDTENLIVKGNSIALEKIRIPKGQECILAQPEEQILYVIEGSLNYCLQKANKTLQKGDSLVLTSDGKFTGIAQEETTLLKFSKLPVNSF